MKQIHKLLISVIIVLILVSTTMVNAKEITNKTMTGSPDADISNWQPGDMNQNSTENTSSNTEPSIINSILRGKLIGNFENNLDGFGIANCGGSPDYKYVSGKIGSALKLWSTGGNGNACAYKDVGSFSEGDTIFFYGKGYVQGLFWDGSIASHISDTVTGCGTSLSIWNDCNEGQPYSNWRLFKVVADRSFGGRIYLYGAGRDYNGEDYAGYYDYVANIWIVPQPKDLWEFIWPGPPASISNLKNVTYQRTYIKWTWTDPNTPDFSKVMVYINGNYKTNVAKGIQYYSPTGLLPNTLYTISTHTVDTYGNVNNNWVNNTARTAR